MKGLRVRTQIAKIMDLCEGDRYNLLEMLVSCKVAKLMPGMLVSRKSVK